MALWFGLGPTALLRGRGLIVGSGFGLGRNVIGTGKCLFRA